MYAVVRTGGKQYRVKEGDLLKVEKLEQPVGAKVALEVLAVGEGEGILVGAPTVGGAKVEAEVVAHGKHRKLWNFRTQEEGWDRIRGHRQPYTELKITGISSQALR
ncbi:MAG TPA: 50S ribosomal protein L21 [Myxococcales bacterium]|nr:50S ribosomal protein L21 [Myxococcales bacterium]